MDRVAFERAGLEPIVGRTKELKRIVAFFGADADHGRALLVSGEAGVGKSVLLDAVAETMAAAGTRVLRADGVEFEADMSFAGLNQILLPIMDAADQLSATYRDALSVALGFGNGAAPGRLVISNAALALLRLVATERPLLVVVDDLPWIDRASAAVLGFVARRLSDSRIGLLAASRAGSQNLFERGGLSEFELPPLDEDSASLLVAARFPGLAGRVRQRLLAEARGNPLALLELPTVLSGSQRAAMEELPTVLPLSNRLKALFVSRVASLPPSCQRLLLLAALDGTGGLGVVMAAASSMDPDIDLADLAAAERDQLVRVDEADRRLGFRHPLIRSAVVEVSTSGERRRAHRALAAVLADQPDRVAFHLAEAALEPDERVATLLEQSAHRVMRRGDAIGAVALLTRAADLSPLGPGRGRRLAQAAYVGAEEAGELSSASELLKSARNADPDGAGSLHAAAAAVYLLINGGGSMDTAHRLLVGAIEAGTNRFEASDSALIDALHTLQLLCWWGGRSELWDPFHTAISRLGSAVPPALAVAAKTFPDPARTGKAAMSEIDAVLDSVRDDADPTHVVRVATASVYVDRVGELREPLWRIVRQGRDGGPARRHVGALMHLCMQDYLTGEWEEAARLADEGLALCDNAGYPFFSWYFQYNQVLLAGARGDVTAGHAIADRMTRWATPLGVGGAVVFANQARTVVCLGGSDYEGAYRYATAVTPAGVLASHVPHALWGAMDLVEAAVRTKRQPEAVAHVRALREADVAALSARLALLVGGSTALCAEDDDAVRLFEEALAVPGAQRWPFDVSRVRLAYGERLRRLGATGDSRGPLDAALVTFERLGARPWAERAAKELRATGWTVGMPGAATADSPADLLTPQELEIAQLAASGLTNKQIAERLYLSHRTVGDHLYRIFPKLAITSRAALRDALTALEKK
jgi:DNA-binding CsgD family transcriptional regulator